jgi:hypothetical protein
MERPEIYQLIHAASAATAVVGGIVAAFRFLRIKSRHERMIAVGEAFRSVVDSLASDNSVKRLSGAILLRRFFSPITELGVAGTPYADECIKVITAMLREEKLSNNVQKILGDSLAYAPSLRNCDLQRTNLSDIYLGDRARKGIDVSDADFFEANLSKASLAGAIACRVVFCKADLRQAKLLRADFQAADFRQANAEGTVFSDSDLNGARFDGAKLTGAVFRRAKNIPDSIAEKLDKNGVYSG